MVFSVVKLGQRLAFSLDFGFRQHDVKIHELTESEMTECFLGLIFFCMLFNVNKIAIINVRSANECLF